MATNYHFRAVASDGKLRTGVLNGETEKLVAAELRRQGLTPVYVGVEDKKSFELKMPFGRRGNRRDVLLFTQELSTLLNAGVPLDRALSITSELTERAVFRLVVQDIIRVLKGGKSLADSIATKPEYFSSLYINMVRAGEASGSLATVFERLSEFERTRDDLRNYVVSSMVYPGLLATVGAASVIFLMTFVIPRFASVFEDSHMVIPTPTRIMLDVSRAVTTYGWIVAVALIGGLIFLRGYIATRHGRLWWDGLRLKLPVLGVALRKAEVARFARAMSTLVANSVPLVQSIGIAGATLNNKRISGSLEMVAQGVKRGEGIAAPLRRSNEFPPLAAHLLSVGEETGRLDHMFARMAEIYETETRTAIRRFTALFEPVVILIMGIIIGALILSMLLAITSMNEVAI
ncbi:MAG TPA: type II secretion system F family protein [Bryobacteraceae bacterium]|nr:type II secretion system F family protein [Bryobacteraceae bacterium]